MPVKQPNPTRKAVSPETAYGRVLRALRTQREMSQEEIAHRSGYHRNYIGSLERGEKSPSLRTVFNLAMVLKIEASDMIRRAEIERG